MTRRATYRLRDPYVEAAQEDDGTWTVQWPPFDTVNLEAGSFTRLFERDERPAPPQLPELTMTIDTTPDPVLRPNQNTGHNKWHGKRAREEKARLRKVAGEAGKSFINDPKHRPPLTPPLFPDTAKVTILVAWERRRSPGYPNGRYRTPVDRHDALPAMCKGIVDGLIDGGIIADDRRIRTTYDQTRDPDGAGYTRIEISA